ncbi:MAG: hypothetical protein P8Y00_05580, partial [Deltaproteobacteria bacterium]
MSPLLAATSGDAGKIAASYRHIETVPKREYNLLLSLENIVGNNSYFVRVWPPVIHHHFFVIIII